VRQVRKLELGNVDSFASICLNSYPGVGFNNETREGLTEWIQRSIQRWPWQDIYGLFDEDVLVGGMCLFDLKINVISQMLPVGGIGTMAVDMLHRKEKAARDLVQFSFSHYKSNGTAMVTLYPFETSFYKKMGFEYGGLVRQYRCSPKAFPKGASKEHIHFLTDENREETLRCYERFTLRNNGMPQKLDKRLSDLFDPNSARIVGYKKDGRILGYLGFTYERKFDFKSNLVITELVYENPDVLLELCTFVSSLTDQFAQIVYDTQDENFHFLLTDPTRSTYDTFQSKYLEMAMVGVGLMYRVIDVKGIFQQLTEHNFGGATCSIRITVNDDFFAENHGSTLVRFKDGKASVEDDGTADAEIKLDVAEFSSLLMGAIDFHSLLRYGLVTISDIGLADTVQRVFRTNQKPMCDMHF
jgi:predicted acetyltransferase